MDKPAARSEKTRMTRPRKLLDSFLLACWVLCYAALLWVFEFLRRLEEGGTRHAKKQNSSEKE